MNILFIGRLDYPPKQGGDAVQIENYKKIISQKGHQVDIASIISKPGDYDIVHLFNFSRLYDLAYQLKTKVKNSPVLILHSIHQKEEYLRRIKELGFKSPGSERIKFIVRNILSHKFKLNQLGFVFRNEKMLRHSLVKKIDFFHFLSNKERTWFEEDLGIKIQDEKVIIFGNAVQNRITRTKNLKDREIDIFIPGRIEPQKNSINTIAALSVFNDKKICFAGQLNRYYKKYCNRFLRLIEKNKNINYMGSTGFSEMEKLYNNSKSVVSLSLSEVAPLVELEALSHGAVFVGTKRCATDCKNPDTSYQVDPENLNEAVNHIREIFKKIESGYVFKFPHINVWEEEMKPLLDLYKKIEK